MNPIIFNKQPRFLGDEQCEINEDDEAVEAITTAGSDVPSFVSKEGTALHFEKEFVEATPIVVLYVIISVLK